MIESHKCTACSSKGLLQVGSDLRNIIQDHHQQFIIKAVNENNTITLEELKILLLEEFDNIQSISASTLYNFLNNQLVEKLDNANAGPYHLVINNVRIHYNLSVCNWLQEINKYILKFLPPYSPFLNPIEECFSKLKNLVKKHSLVSKETLCERIQSSSYQIIKQNYES
ncbi:hypothetical protein PHYBLDRAFT_58515 [Phycomyces blakesleeanus NRRL 1555(-)]|uniref:Tc1-like transposase DDE domain-containing protein n=1 Tax=Phycomyces blakesleeanus (strain ATCC 8743b / DSM 1359 / FGSC 10004 / NBRC 33097 / NRRL 1555) TaxID=763407 RepID=A0A167QC87_PHYB8|nr:hypothetical protein PHYBLDRAFT_58515 [Phycomyces blakesleeanus NRRL 1555(-)]OAD79466.1 hypothetical protein PHYBLDRAFT_58515 [Phycomyces blakesleeanus NRRL 1555(-)]|eukprot:XP_018297506.1 hypothetical protein PHYBLDRAFT_58515 [Phycomyces blakesleeanus NRRL 1555(-)]